MFCLTGLRLLQTSNYRSALNFPSMIISPSHSASVLSHNHSWYWRVLRRTSRKMRKKSGKVSCFEHSTLHGKTARRKTEGDPGWEGASRGTEKSRVEPKVVARSVLLFEKLHQLRFLRDFVFRKNWAIEPKLTIPQFAETNIFLFFLHSSFFFLFFSFWKEKFVLTSIKNEKDPNAEYT